MIQTISTSISQNFHQARLNLIDFLTSSNIYPNIDQILLNHGCWCSKLNPENDVFSSILGGNQPVDELDSICKKWFTIRSCNDRLQGGSCSQEFKNLNQTYEINIEFISEENENNQDYLFNPDLNFTDFSQFDAFSSNQYFYSYTCTNDNQPCLQDTCSIDMEFVSRIIEYLEYVKDGDEIFEVLDLSQISCQKRNFVNQQQKFCCGIAPSLYISEDNGFGLG